MSNLDWSSIMKQIRRIRTIQNLEA